MCSVLWLGYDAPLALFVAIAWLMIARGRSGKLSRALLLTGVIGAVTPWITYFSYIAFVPKPVVPHHVIEDSPSFLMLIFNLLNKAGSSLDLLGYDLDLLIYPIFFGGLSILITFPLSFAFPCHAANQPESDNSINPR